MKVKFWGFLFFCLAVVFLLGLAGCSLPQRSTASPVVLIQFPTLSPLTETAFFESTFWTPTSTGTITLIPTVTDTLEPSHTPRPPTHTPIQPTDTATLQYTYTPTSTFTATITPHTTKTASMTPTYAIYTKTPVTWGCTVQSVDPTGYKRFHPNDDFDGHFTVVNTGQNDWNPNKMSYRFISGTVFHKYDSKFGIPNGVAVNDTLSVTIDMKAPGTPGNYFSVWSFEHSENTICLITFSITVLAK